jgi:hypothetical protein
LTDIADHVESDLRREANALSERRAAGEQQREPRDRDVPVGESEPNYDAKEHGPGRTLTEASAELSADRRKRERRDGDVLIDEVLRGEIVDRAPDSSNDSRYRENVITKQRQLHVDGETLSGAKAEAHLLSEYRAQRAAVLQATLEQREHELSVLDGKRVGDVVVDAKTKAEAAGVSLSLDDIVSELHAASAHGQQQPQQQQSAQQPMPPADLDAAANDFQTRNADITSVEDLNRLAQHDPVRAKAIFEEASKLLAAKAQQPQSADHPAVAAEREKLTTERRRMFQAAVQGFEQAAVGQFNREFGDIRTSADVERVRATDPQRFAKLQHLANELKQGIDGFTSTGQAWAAHDRQKAEADQRNFAAWEAAEDAEFYRRVPEYRGTPEHQREVGRKTLDGLLNLGVTPDEIQQLKRNPAVRSAKGMQILHRALVDLPRVEAELAVLKAEKANGLKYLATKQLPPVQRPGVGTLGAGNGDVIQSLQRQLAGAKGTKAIQLAAQLRSARRAAAGG